MKSQSTRQKKTLVFCCINFFYFFYSLVLDCQQEVKHQNANFSLLQCSEYLGSWITFETNANKGMIAFPTCILMWHVNIQGLHAHCISQVM